MTASLVMFWLGGVALFGHLAIGNYWAGKR